MYKAPTGPVGTLHQALRKDLQNIPTSDPSADTAKRMADILRDIAEAMRAAERPLADSDDGDEEGDDDVADLEDRGIYWRRCS